MTSITTVVQSLGVAMAAGVNLPATVAVLGISERAGWIGPLPGVLGAVGSIRIIAIFIWSHPYITITVAILVLILLILVVHRIVVTLRKLFSGEWKGGATA